MIILVIAVLLSVVGLVVCYFGLPHKDVDVPQEVIDLRNQSQRAADGEVY